MEDQELRRALTEALRLISEWKPLPKRVTAKLDPATLKRLLAMVEQLRAEGLAGPRHRTPERLLALQRMIDSWMGKEPEPEGETYPGQRENEALAFRQINTQQAMDDRRTLTELRRA